MKRFCSWGLLVVSGFLIVFGIQRTVHAAIIPDGYIPLFEANNIYSYIPCKSANESTNSDSCIGTLPGVNNEEVIWNYLVEANIDGVSNNPAAIAGIMGNLKQESGFNPFAVSNDYYGIFQTNKDSLQAVDDAGLGEYWGSSSAPQDIMEKAIKLELDYLTRENQRFRGEGVWGGKGFLSFVDEVSNKTPEAYSDLFLVTYEGAVADTAESTHMSGVSNVIEDEIAKKASEAIHNRVRYFQEAGKRREYARELYDKYASSAACFSSSGFNGEEVTWEDLNPLSPNDRLKLMVEVYGEYAMQLQKYYGIPWEMPFAVMIFESQVGADTESMSYIIQQAGYYNLMGLTFPVSGRFPDNKYRVANAGTNENGCFSTPTYPNCFVAYDSISKMLLGYTIYHGRSGYMPSVSYDAGLKLLSPDNYQLGESIQHLMETYCEGGCYRDRILSIIRSGGDNGEWTGLLDVVREKGWKNSEELAKEWNIQPGGIATERWGWGDIRQQIWEAYGEAGLPSNATIATGAVPISSDSSASSGDTLAVTEKAVLHTPKNPWLDEVGLEGFIKDEVDLDGKDGIDIDSAAVVGGQYAGFASDAGNGSGLPGFIVLHLTSSDNFDAKSWTNYCGPSQGLEFYCPPHFTIDVKNKEIYQHFPLTAPSAAVSNRGSMRADRYGIQVEIVGHGGDEGPNGTCVSGACSNEYLYTNFSEEDWDYIAKLLVAISDETGIPLTSTLVWPDNKQAAESQVKIQSNDELKSYIGVLGHMHINNKWDPLSVWTYIEPALQRVGYSYISQAGQKDFACRGDIEERVEGTCFQLPNEADGGCTDDGFVYFRQCGPTWADSPYGTCGTICSSACGPSSIAAIITALTGKLVIPTETAEKGVAVGARVCGSGTDVNRIATIVTDYGLNFEHVPDGEVTVENVNKWLDEGKMMLFSVGAEYAPTFTRSDGSSGAENLTGGGHVIAIRGKTSDGKYLTFDSAGNTEDRNNRGYDPNDLLKLYKLHGRSNFNVISR